MDIAGGDEIADMLDRLGKAEQREFKKAAKRSTREGLKPMHQAARAAAPRVSGRLRKAIKLRTWRRPKPGEVGMKLFIDPGKSRDDPAGAYYGEMIECGHVASGTYVPGRYMIRNAEARFGVAAQDNLAKDLAREADRVIKGK